jgi:putative glutathione S-transferase
MNTRAEFPNETGRRGEFIRQKSVFRDWITADGSSGYRAEPGRYHLYISYACPWAHRTVIFRKLKGLEDVIGMTVVDPIRDERGWAFTDAVGGPDPLNGFRFLAERIVGDHPHAQLGVQRVGGQRKRRLLSRSAP